MRGKKLHRGLAALRTAVDGAVLAQPGLPFSRCPGFRHHCGFARLWREAWGLTASIHSMRAIVGSHARLLSARRFFAVPAVDFLTFNSRKPLNRPVSINRSSVWGRDAQANALAATFDHRDRDIASDRGPLAHISFKNHHGLASFRS